ncbi:hypothetical protein BC940DRAFT_327327 [Gongronella butleri]|nr:hypothetical protein BC940DRAFT_327327 [Gongronella butleri]
MPCLGSRKKKKTPSTTTIDRAAAQDHMMNQMKQEYHDLKSKNDEHLDVIARQSAELARLREQLDTNKSEYSSIEQLLADMEKRNRDNMSNLQKKEELLAKREEELESVMRKMEADDGNVKHKLAAKDELLETKEQELAELKQQWQSERAELIKPALQEVTEQLDQLKRTNEEVQKRLADKEGELAELRSELTRRERRPNSKGQDERQKRLNRLTMDLENDRLMIQKLEELNQQLEAQKKQHEAVLQTHAEAIAEKDRELVEHQQSLSQIKSQHQQAVRALEQKQSQALMEARQRHEADMSQLKERLTRAEKQAQNEMNEEVEKLLREFEQSEYDHTAQLAHLERSHKQQMSSMRQNQKAEIKHHIQKRNSMIITNNHPLPSQFSSTTPSAASEDAEIAVPAVPARRDSALASPTTSTKVGSSSGSNETHTSPVPLRKTGGPAANKVLRWPTPLHDLQPDLVPKDPRAIHVYISSVSANSTIKRNQEAIQTILQATQVTFQVIDVARREPALQHMRRQTQGRSVQLPLVFVGGQFRGQLEDLIQAQDDGTLDIFLGSEAAESKSDNGPTARPSAIPVPTASLSGSKSRSPSNDALANERHMNGQQLIIGAEV